MKITYVIAELFFPSLKYLYDIIKSQKDDSVQTPMTIRFATMMRYAVWKMYDPSDLDPELQPILRDCAHLFLQACYSISQVDDKRWSQQRLVIPKQRKGCTIWVAATNGRCVGRDKLDNWSAQSPR